MGLSEKYSKQKHVGGRILNDACSPPKHSKLKDCPQSKNSDTHTHGHCYNIMFKDQLVIISVYILLLCK